jgi:hypothetical protein
VRAPEDDDVNACIGQGLEVAGDHEPRHLSLYPSILGKRY